jgi:Flp pilus assembly protein TadB
LGIRSSVKQSRLWAYIKRKLLFAYRLVSFGEMRILRRIAKVPSTAETRLNEMAEWQFARLTNTARACVGTGVTFIAGLLTTQFKDTLVANHTVLAVAVAAAAVVIALGFMVYARLRRYNELYAESLDKLRRLGGAPGP